MNQKWRPQVGLVPEPLHRTSWRGLPLDPIRRQPSVNSTANLFALRHAVTFLHSLERSSLLGIDPERIELAAARCHCDLRIYVWYN